MFGNADLGQPVGGARGRFPGGRIVEHLAGVLRKRPVLVYFPGLKTSTALQVNTSARGATGRSPRAFVMAFAQIIKKSVL